MRVPFEHGFQLKMRIAGRTLFQRSYLVLRHCPFQTFVKKIVNVMLVFTQIRSSFTRNKMADVQEFLAIYVSFYVILVIFYNGIIEIMQG